MNLIGQWNKDKTQCWQIGTRHYMDKQLNHCWEKRAECWSNTPDNPNTYTLTRTMPWRDTMEEAQKDIPHEKS